MSRGGDFCSNTCVTVRVDETAIDGEGSLGEVAGVCLYQMHWWSCPYCRDLFWISLMEDERSSEHYVAV